MGGRDQGVRGPKGGERPREAQGAFASRQWAANRRPPNFEGPRAERGARLWGALSAACARSPPWHLLIGLTPFPDRPLPPALALNPFPHPTLLLKAWIPNLWTRSLNVCARLLDCYFAPSLAQSPYLLFTHTLLLSFSFSVTRASNLK